MKTLETFCGVLVMVDIALILLLMFIRRRLEILDMIKNVDIVKITVPVQQTAERSSLSLSL